MLSESLIRRRFEHQEHDRLLRELAENGTPMPVGVRARLAAAGPAPAIALGLRRLGELTYGPTPTAREMTRALLADQRPDGGFAAGQRDDPLATAAALAGLNRVIAEMPAAADARALHAAREGAIAAIDKAALDRLAEENGGELAAFAMLMLAQTPGATELPCWRRLEAALERQPALSGEATCLRRLAQVEAQRGHRIAA